MTGTYAHLCWTLAPWLFLAACDGSGGGSSPTPTPVPMPTPAANTAPGFTSPNDFTLVENSVVAYQAVAVDLEGDPVTFTIAGGVDADAFTITPSGTLSFITPPNYEVKTDRGEIGAFFVTLRASDGKANTEMGIRIIITNSREGIAVKRVATGFNKPTYLTAVPGDPARVLVTEKDGQIWFLTPATGAKTLAMTVGNLSTTGNRGLLGLAARPDFQSSGIIFVHATGTDGALEIREYRIGTAGHRTVLRTPHSADKTTGGWLGFGPDGYLYDLTGADGGSTAQDTSNRAGKVLRIKIDPAPGSATPFAPAPGNPFLIGGGDPYVFAYGLANPYRGSFYGNTLLLGDVGSRNLFDEVNMVPVDQPGLNFGAPLVEGNYGTIPPGTTLPVAQYDLGPVGKGVVPGAIIGGYVYRGPVASLVGQYVFGDYVRNRVLSVPVSALALGRVYPQKMIENRNLDFVPDVGSITALTSFGEDNGGNLFLLTYDGQIFMVVPS